MRKVNKFRWVGSKIVLGLEGFRLLCFVQLGYLAIATGDLDGPRRTVEERRAWPSLYAETQRGIFSRDGSLIGRKYVKGRVGLGYVKQTSLLCRQPRNVEGVSGGLVEGGDSCWDVRETLVKMRRLVQEGGLFLQS